MLGIEVFESGRSRPLRYTHDGPRETVVVSHDPTPDRKPPHKLPSRSNPRIFPSTVSRRAWNACRQPVTTAQDTRGSCNSRLPAVSTCLDHMDRGAGFRSLLVREEALQGLSHLSGSLSR